MWKQQQVLSWPSQIGSIAAAVAIAVTEQRDRDSK